ncbi:MULTISPECIES: cobalamin biosynthesis protein CobG [unclassified Streptomyces]|uniref:cobalamin biosynthesis protein CobG n=1 Tax=unclassified Streptomyces TaxID=2593676 RepID=UPI001010B489|nr:cobalamin biosynthesis protein CobG [Streptomyces sp. GZWMJZ-114]
MLAAMPSPLPRPAVPPASPAPPASAAGGRGDACPGALRLHLADDGGLARVRIPGGVLDAGQWEALGALALRHGDGDLHLTSRGNVQLRGLDPASGDALGRALAEAGLLPSPAHERVRNIVASPLSGLDGHGVRPVRAWLRALDAGLCGSARAAALSGRFLFALDDGRGDMTALRADVTLRALPGDEALVSVGGARFVVAADAAPRAALRAAEVFLDAAARAPEGTRLWRVAELPDGPPLAEAVRDRLADEGVPTRTAVAGPPLPEAAPPAPGPYPGALAVHAPLGRLSPAAWRELAHAGTELRLTPWRGVVVAGPAGDAAARLAGAGLVTAPGSPWPRVGACVGHPGCARARADVRGDAARALPAVASSPLPMYWSACERRCGRPAEPHADVVAGPDGGYLLSVPGRAPRPVDPADPARLAAALRAPTGP